MSVIIQGSQIRQILLGSKVERATAALPQTATGNIYTVAGGRILVTGLVGEVTVATGAVATNLKISTAPTTGTAVDLTANTLVTSKEVGSQYTLPAASGSAGIVKNGGAGGQFPTHQPYIIPIGAISITTDASDTGSMKWTLTYIPLDDGASVVAA
ncbi:MAG: hypothetical protein JWQ81_8511 [Amycolatopsis sp.]|jgi:hypothetical protein|uniref:hypothetical protein n=1 Tax=Amycolatopsis sp. TaxID=37632 RepID=UPI00261F3A0A|nr:hypothetical protein [Amycolatopsis sp.]MCU1687772.1 hypothetical protein [Amycolatopsis sp.]